MQPTENEIDSPGDLELDMLARLKTEPDDMSALFELHTYYKEQDRYEEEDAILRQLLEKDLSADERAEALHDLMYALYRQGSLEAAISSANDLLDAYPDYRHIGSVLWLLGVLYVACVNSPGHESTCRQELTAAEHNFRRALEYVDDKEERARILVELGMTLCISGKLEDGRLALEQALASGIDDPLNLICCYQRMGMTLSRQGRVEQARSYYERATLVCPDLPNNFAALAYVGLATLCREEGDLERAEQYCLQARQVVDESRAQGAETVLESLYEELGDIAFHRGDYPQAAHNYQAALQQALLPENQEELYDKLSMAFQWGEQYKRALEVLRQALALGLALQPTNEERIGEILFQMGRCAYSLLDYSQAIILFEKASEKVGPALLADVQLSLGHSYFCLKRYNEAATSYQIVLHKASLLSRNWKRAVKYLLWARLPRGDTSRGGGGNAR